MVKEHRLPVYSDGSQARELIFPGACMTKAQALRYANKVMPNDLRKAGFKAGVFESDIEIHGAHYFRIGFGMTVQS